MSGVSARSRPVIVIAATAVSLALSISSVTAATLTLSSGGTLGALSANFNPSNIAAINADGIGVGTPITIFNGTSNSGGLLLSANATLTFTFMGKEAGYTDQLLFGNSVLFNNNVAPGTEVSVSGSTGIIPFLFRAVTPGNRDANNGGPIANGLQIAFARVSDTTFYAFFDDGGAGPDHDFDDMVVRITDPPAATPLPAALPLFASGAGMFGYFSLRRRKKA